MAEENSQDDSAEVSESITGDGWPSDDDNDNNTDNDIDASISADDATIEEDDETLSSAASMDSPASAEAGESASSEVIAQVDDTSDAASIDTADDSSPSEHDDNNQYDPTQVVVKKAHGIAVQLKTVELEVRRMLDVVDNKRKRKLGGTRRWNELEDDIASWRYSGRHDEQTLCQLRLLISRRHYLFKELSNLASIRPVLNS